MAHEAHSAMGGQGLAAAALNPRSIAVIGASDNPHKVGGRPLMYLERFGYTGHVYPVNPHRRTVQGRPSFPDLASLPETPQLAIVATPREAASDAIDACVARGVDVAIVMASGFGETHDLVQVEAERELVARARAAGMRLVGPNSQGLANFGNGVVASFSTMFLDPVPVDGPVAIISQSGVMSVMPLALLHRTGIGVRYSLATGNEADVTAAELALAVLDDPQVKLILFYLESLRDPARLAAAAALARERDVPIVAVKAGRSARAQAVARSHTGALASEDRIVDAFLHHHGIWRVNDMKALVRTAPLYLRGWRPTRGRLVVVSNSGASCVMAADTANDLGLPLATLDAAVVDILSATLPAFAASANPLDITTALMQDGSALGRILPALATPPAGDLFLVALPIAGEGYDIDAMVRDVSALATEVHAPVVVTTPQPTVAARFRDAGLPTYDDQTDATEALSQIVAHTLLMQRPRAPRVPVNGAPLPGGSDVLLHEADALAWLEQQGVPVVPHRLCLTDDEARVALRDLGGRVAIKACSRDVAHKAAHGLVTLDVTNEGDITRISQQYVRRLSELGARCDGLLVARMVSGREFILGTTIDPHFGPVVMIGAGGCDVESLDDVAFLLPPFGTADVRRALARTRTAPRGRLADTLDLEALSAVTVHVGNIAAGAIGVIDAIDLNPVLVGVAGTGVTIVDALVQRAQREQGRLSTH